MGKPMDDHFLESYRRLLDAEDAAFDELGPRARRGDRPHFDMELGLWQEALTRKLTFLQDAGYEVAVPAGAR